MAATANPITMNDGFVRLYVSWEENNGKYLTQQINAFEVEEQRDYLELRSYLKSILLGKKSAVEQNPRIVKEPYTTTDCGDRSDVLSTE
ncbi:hypothetical protein GGR55DRAFT_673159 [Xylaria sp. FL0064]|nr:hypothetical protein GGR55DRAFT_673159 [Xylaria sp. FL0064]